MSTKDRRPSLSRRKLLERLALGAGLGPLAAVGMRAALAAELPLLAADSPEARALKYVEEAKAAKDAKPGNTCANCGLYQGAAGAARGPCQLFAGKDVKAAGWCSAWAPQM